MVQSGVGGLLNTMSLIYMTLMSENITLLPQCLPHQYMENRLAQSKYASCYTQTSQVTRGRVTRGGSVIGGSQCRRSLTP